MVLEIVGITLGLMFVGLIKEIVSLKRFGKDLDFLYEYNENYVEYLNNYLGKNISSEEEETLHSKLIRKTPKAQRLVGRDGLIDYKPAGSAVMYSNYQVITNTIHSLRNPILMSEEFSWVNNMLIMKMSGYEEIIENIISDMKNPIILIREGVQFFVTLPISLLYWTGLIKYSTQYKLSNNFVVKLLSFLIILIGLVSSVMGIVLGWEQFTDILYKFLQ